MYLIFGLHWFPGPIELLIILAIVLLFGKRFEETLSRFQMSRDPASYRQWLSRQRYMHQKMLEAKRLRRATRSRTRTIMVAVICVLLLGLALGRLIGWW
ncbi:MAG: hypothetical protein ACYSWU_26870 [Planctomycetota bacterium]|jgi:hypothetical protein